MKRGPMDHVGLTDEGTPSRRQWYVVVVLLLVAAGAVLLAHVLPLPLVVLTVVMVGTAGLLLGVFTFASWMAMRGDRQRSAGSVPAPLRRELEARRVPIRVVASSGRRELPSAERVG